MRPAWVAEVRDAGMDRVGPAFGMQRRGRAWGPCPACEAETRGKEDRRLPVGPASDGVGWRCFACGAGGDTADLAALRVLGVRLTDASVDQRQAVRAACAEAGLCAPEGPPQAPERLTRRPRARTGRAGGDPRRSRFVRRGDPAAPAHEAIEADPGPADPVATAEAPWPDGPAYWDDDLVDRSEDRLWRDPEAAPVRAYLTGGLGAGPGGSDGRRLPEASLRAFRIGAHRTTDGTWWATIPLLDERTGDPVNVKFCRVPGPDGTRGRPKYLACPRRPLPLFGASLLSNDLGHVMVVEGELDVVAAWTYGLTRDVVSGTAGAGTWDDTWTDQLEPYQTIGLALDPDDAGDAGVALLQERLGRHRCARVTMPRKDLSECWLHAVDLSAIELAVERARPLVGLRVETVGAYRTRLRAGRRDPGVLIGPATGCRALDDMFGGWPYGLTVVTGTSGGGKTSFCAWAARQHALAGGTPLVTGLEQQPIGIVKKLVHQQIGGDIFSASDEEFDAAVDELEAMGIRVVDHYGRVKVADVIETARYWRRRHGTEFVLVDHLGYLVDQSKDDTVRQIDGIVQALATSGAQDRIAYLLIAHPDKASRQLKRPTVQTLRGSASIDQEASLGLCVEQPRDPGPPRTRVHCDKQRGEWGHGAGSHATLYYGVVSGLLTERYEDLPTVDRGAQPAAAAVNEEVD